MSSGDEIEKPKILIMAPTANAASIIKGKTIESCLGINPQEKWNYVKAGKERQSKLKFVYDEVTLLFFDELSMIGTNKFAKVNFQIQSLQEGPAKSQFLGGKSAVLGGDMHQLPPINDRFIFENSTIDGRSGLATSYWDQHFRIFYLTEKMRCSGDMEYAAICDRVGDGKITTEDEAYFQSRVMPTDLEYDNINFKEGKIAIVVTTNHYREEINNEKLASLIPSERQYKIDSVDRTLNLSSGAPLPTNLPYTQTGSLPGQLFIKVGAPVVITSNHRNKRWKEDGIMNGARGYIDHIDVSEDNPEEVTVIWVVFKNREHGAKYRKAPEHLKLRNFRDLHEDATPILPTKKTFKVKTGNVEYQRKQFALSLGYAVTVHKVQGETLDFVIGDFRDGFVKEGSFYVTITRVRNGCNLFLRDFNPAYVRASRDVNNKIADMRENKKYVFFKTFLHEKCFKIDSNDLKIGYLNVNCLLDGLHAEYVNADKNLLNLHYLCLSDTRLTKKDDQNKISQVLSNWLTIFRKDSSDGRRHMGLLILSPKHSWENNSYKGMQFEYSEDLKTKSGDVRGQFIHAHDNREIITFTYFSQTPSLEEVSYICKLTNKSHYILGDLNLNNEIPEQMQKLNQICGSSKILHLRSVTTVRQNQLDHIIVERNKKYKVYSDSFFNFVSDHKTIIIRISQYINDEIHCKEKEEIEICSNKSDSEDTYSEERPPFESLLGETWVNDEVVNGFGDLLMKKYRGIFIFSTYFCHFFFTLKRDYKDLKTYDKSGGLFECRAVMIPILQHCHWFLCVLEYQRGLLYILDPLLDKDNQKNLVSQHQATLAKLEKDFLEVHMRRKHHRTLNPLIKSVQIPPTIPEQKDGFNCAPFMLQFERCLAMNTSFSFSNSDMVSLRRLMRRELMEQSISEELLTQSINMKFSRKITNYDGETCWLNVLLQMLLSALDYDPARVFFSELGTMIQAAQTQPLIDSRDFKILIQNEINKNAARYQEILTDYQDTRDSLIILTENSQSWPDIYDMIQHTTKSSVTCQACNWKSEGGGVTQQLYSEIHCPQNNTNLRSTLEYLTNHGEEIQYTCEHCNTKGTGRRREQIITEASSNFLVICVKRTGSSYGHNIQATDDLTLLDSQDSPRVYTPISIIHHRGGIEPRPGSTRHYLCDIKFRDNNQWYRTSDASEPKKLTGTEVTTKGYIILFRRKHISE